jgi:2-C-methyl-D-erythritol 2,4-cyclodiphosphate synthase
MVTAKGFRIVNLDTIVFAETPKLGSQRQDMQQMIAKTMNVTAEQVNVKATTTEGLGVIGKGEGIGAMCVALLE